MLKTFPASIPATDTPDIKLNAIKCNRSIVFDRHLFTIGSCLAVIGYYKGFNVKRPWYNTPEYNNIAIVLCTINLYVDTLGLD